MPALAIILGYLLGSIPSAYILVRLFKKEDVRKIGSGNVGTLNVMREVSQVLGFAVLLMDMGKGALAVLVAMWLGVDVLFVYLAGFASVLGHILPVFSHFKGGRGLATTMGVLLAVVPLQFLISFAILAAVVLITNNPRLGAIVGLALLPLIVWLFGESLDRIIFSAVMPFFLLLMMIPDIKKLPREKGNLIVDRRYKPWQKRK